MTLLGFGYVFLLGAATLYAWLIKKKKEMSLIPEFTVAKIGKQWIVNNSVRYMEPQDRQEVIRLLLEEIDTMDDGTEYDLG